MVKSHDIAMGNLNAHAHSGHMKKSQRMGAAVNALYVPVAGVIATGVVWWVGAAESLARRNDRAALSRVPNGASVASAGASAGAVVKAMSLAWVVVTAWSETIC